MGPQQPDDAGIAGQPDFVRPPTPEFADPAAFCLCFLGGFLASLPVLASVVSGGAMRGGGAAS